jgi:hypothetical protein
MMPERIEITLHVLPLRRWLQWRYERTVMDAVLRLGPITVLVSP